MDRLISEEDRQGPPDDCHWPGLTTVLATDWPDGLRRLVAANYPVAGALQRADEHVHLLSILLDSPQPIFSAKLDFRFSLLYCTAPEMSDIILDELRKRRTALRDLAIQFLSPNVQKELGISKEEMLDANAEAVFHRLKQVTDVPDALDCWVSPYHMLDWDYATCKHLDKFHDAGFRAVDIPDAEGYTPLQIWLECQPMSSAHDVLYWLLSRGAKPEWASMLDPEDVRYYTVLSHLALKWRVVCMQHVRHVSNLFKAFENYSDIVPATLHMVRDGCPCFCGTGGCLPIHLLWRCNSRRCDCYGSKSHNRRDWIFLWFNAWRLSEQQKELLCSEVIRLELFERLGMAHTCCCSSTDSWDDLYPRICPDEDERTRMQDEDEEHSLQLEDLMSHYNTAAKRHHGTYESFWEIWWQVVDDILPPLLPMEACKNRFVVPWRRNTQEFRDRDRTTMENRAAREADALHRAGYVEPDLQDFRDVIRMHFSGRDWNPEGWEPKPRDRPPGDGTDDGE
ncbi:hypothetical protein GE09DRAFT_619905 [Coniochaeta sp. 2T2.1]|nr:hypothetical protein GE09DRAFT_619905 [Coniochaeta sp. 2T2.1]